MKTRSRLFLATVVLALTTIPALGSTQATNTNTISPTMKVNVTVQDAIQLTLSSGAGCTINPGGGADYNMSFGNVDALAITAPACGNKFAPTTPGTTNAAYYTDYKLTPIFTSQNVSTNTLKAYVSTNFAKANLSVVYATSLPGTIAGLSAMGTTLATANTLATNAVSGTALTQYLGVEIAPTNGAALTGADAATITYTLTVQLESALAIRYWAPEHVGSGALLVFSGNRRT
jgi:hypothetical protein